jgi:hypothetical protein
MMFLFVFCRSLLHGRDGISQNLVLGTQGKDFILERDGGCRRDRRFLDFFRKLGDGELRGRNLVWAFCGTLK